MIRILLPWLLTFRNAPTSILFPNNTENHPVIKPKKLPGPKKDPASDTPDLSGAFRLRRSSAAVKAFILVRMVDISNKWLMDFDYDKPNLFHQDNTRQGFFNPN
jgi:hypothetical protein